jgi:hypothetical protein
MPAIDTSPGWRRTRPQSTVQSSDASNTLLRAT